MVLEAFPGQKLLQRLSSGKWPELHKVSALDCGP
jgi:hypothetical protein